MINSVILVGKVFSEPEFKQGREYAIAKMILKTTYINRNNMEKSEHIPVTAFNKEAEKVAQLKVGDCIAMDGVVKGRTVSKDGKEYNMIDINALTISKISQSDYMQKITNENIDTPNEDIPF